MVHIHPPVWKPGDSTHDPLRVSRGRGRDLSLTESGAQIKRLLVREPGSGPGNDIDSPESRVETVRF